MTSNFCQLLIDRAAAPEYAVPGSDSFVFDIDIFFKQAITAAVCDGIDQEMAIHLLLSAAIHMLEATRPASPLEIIRTFPDYGTKR